MLKPITPEVIQAITSSLVEFGYTSLTTEDVQAVVAVLRLELPAHRVLRRDELVYGEDGHPLPGFLKPAIGRMLVDAGYLET